VHAAVVQVHISKQRNHHHHCSFRVLRDFEGLRIRSNWLVLFAASDSTPLLWQYAQAAVTSAARGQGQSLWCSPCLLQYGSWRLRNWYCRLRKLVSVTFRAGYSDCDSRRCFHSFKRVFYTYLATRNWRPMLRPHWFWRLQC
jgi:hypothetical protein